MLPSGKSKSTNGRTPLEWGSLSSWGPSKRLKKNSGWAAACWPAWRTLASLSGCARLLFNLCTTLRTLPHSLSGRGQTRRSGPPSAGRLILTAILRRMPPSGCEKRAGAFGIRPFKGMDVSVLFVLIHSPEGLNVQKEHAFSLIVRRPFQENKRGGAPTPPLRVFVAKATITQ